MNWLTQSHWLKPVGIPHVGRGAVCPEHRPMGWHFPVEDLTAIQPAKSQSGFYYHHVPATLNNIRDNVFLKSPIWSNSSIIAVTLSSFDYLHVYIHYAWYTYTQIGCVRSHGIYSMCLFVYICIIYLRILLVL